MTMPGKSVLSRLRKPKIADDVPYAIHGIVRNGRSGVAIYHRGEMTAWGQNSTAAWASHHSAQAINRSLAKSDDWEVPVGHFEPALPRRRPNYGAGNTVGKRMTGAVTGVASPKKVQGTRVAARTASASMPKVGAMPTVNGRQLSPGDVGKRKKQDWKMVPTRHPIASNVAAGALAGGLGAGLGTRNLEAAAGGAAGGAVVGTVPGLVILRQQHKRGSLAHRERRMADARHESASKRDRSYNPEASRQRRLGVAGGLAGVAGVASVGSGVRESRRATHTLRDIDPGVIKVPSEPRKPPGKMRGDHGKFRPLSEDESGAAQRSYDRKVGERARMSATHEGLKNAKAVGEKGAVITRRAGGKIALGTGLLAAGGGISRYSRGRSNREWH